MNRIQKRLADRKAVNLGLAHRDAANRCSFCKVSLLDQKQYFKDFIVPGKYCSDACVDAARERANQ